MKKKFIIFLSVFSILSPSTVFAEDICTVTVPTAIAESEVNAGAIMPMSDVIIWRYQLIGNKMYRRRYNTTKKQWIGDWELAP
ncbi:hypothetical protein AALC16_11600 [Lachnospiraceae bacterium 29-91]